MLIKGVRMKRKGKYNI